MIKEILQYLGLIQTPTVEDCSNYISDDVVNKHFNKLLEISQRKDLKDFQLLEAYHQYIKGIYVDGFNDAMNANNEYNNLINNK